MPKCGEAVRLIPDGERGGKNTMKGLEAGEHMLCSLDSGTDPVAETVRETWCAGRLDSRHNGKLMKYFNQEGGWK